MKIIEAALYKLALNRTITIEEAKILKTLHSQRACTEYNLRLETGISMNEFDTAIFRLERKNMVSKRGGIYFCENFLEKLAELIRTGTVQKNQTLLTRAR